MTTTDRERYAAEQWFWRRGLPTVVRGRPTTQVLVRGVGAVAFLAVWELITDVLIVIDGSSDQEFERLMDNDLFALGYNGLLVGLVVLPPLAAWLGVRWSRRHTTDGRDTSLPAQVVAVTAFAGYVVVWPVIGYLIDSADDIASGVLTNLGLVVAILVVTFAGGGSIVCWAVRAAFRQVRTLGTMTSRAALSFLLLVTIFGFFTAEIWQANSALARHQMWLVVGFFAALSVWLLSAMMSDELHELIGSRPPEAGADKLRGSPFETYVDDPLVVGREHVPLRPVERVNMVLVLLLAQAFQALVFAVLMFGFFVTFGMLAVRPEIMKAWSGRDPSVGELFGIQVPVPNELLQVSIFLAAFSALYIVASTATDARYRQAFFQPLAEHMAVSLSARHIYLTRWGGATR
ncbi:hypothetical protein JOF56_009998 [Kibdelosporangium banguiense]|uniref:Integral membrane protein n=1 Tax=Kibdelosporangium banguiense TaxID=1365924 RepID=A0ABS4TYY5_9PSEU|nr:hypothetical protein [Kibdelosporangium banguiense]MBP2329613.1 hypothetical protein [Kibdelosporangium banguiense]